MRRPGGGIVEENGGDSMLESMPLDILMKILCGVDHDDLKPLFHVSNTIRDSTMVVRKTHFAYKTPSKRRLLARLLRSSFFSNGEKSFSGLEELQTPCVPKKKPRLARKRSFSPQPLFWDEE